jgi:hypothetical protein
MARPLLLEKLPRVLKPTPDWELGASLEVGKYRAGFKEFLASYRGGSGFYPAAPG